MLELYELKIPRYACMHSSVVELRGWFFLMLLRRSAGGLFYVEVQCGSSNKSTRALQGEYAAVVMETFYVRA